MPEYMRKSGSSSPNADQLREMVAEAKKAFQQAIVSDRCKDPDKVEEQKRRFWEYQDLKRQLEEMSSSIAA